ANAPGPQQLPARQVPPPHEWPQVPQFVALVCVSTQVPLQLVWPVGQHLALEQVLPAPHTVAQVPQCELSVCRSKHVPLQPVRPGEQQAAPEQLFPPVQTFPQEPQLFGSVVSSTHAVGVTTGHLSPAQWQALDEQVSPGKQGWPQPPQFATSVLVSTQSVGFTVGHSSGKVAGQPQLPAVQTSRVSVHAMSQAAQCAGSVWKSTQRGFPPQSIATGVPAQTQAPAVHGASAVATPGPAQTCPHTPQFFASLPLSTQVPGAVPHRSGFAAGQPQRPPVHVAPVAHRRKHTPQSNGFVWRSTQMPSQLVCPEGHS
ncbi:MAG TPA: hypothetical protein VLU43_10125, partial [Anaeromyxobacteraceae bacterium]|nr:hypothetical protein [Anaeromyxobacteraceae bacterium]